MQKSKKVSNTWKILRGTENGYVINNEKRVKHIMKHVGKHSKCQHWTFRLLFIIRNATMYTEFASEFNPT